MKRLDDYRGIIDDNRIAAIYKKVRNLYDAHIVHINSTAQGGGVAEMLTSLVPLMNDIGIDAGWRVLHGNTDFYRVTKGFHNALQGEDMDLTDIKKEIYVRTNENFSTFTHLNHDYIIVHDPQPLPLIQFYRKNQPWIWRCHIDLSHPNLKVWRFLKGFALKYDKVLVSNEAYKQGDLPVEQKIVLPAIDPLSLKNKDLSDETLEEIKEEYEIPNEKPLITQISRFDKWKDPEGVIEVYKRVKKKIDCRLILCGSMASDDPEGSQIYYRLREHLEEEIKSRDVILLTVENHLLVNALQRVSSVIIQKSTREGFGLTVTEAMWKETPVVASRVGGIPLQIDDGVNGFLFDPKDYDGFAEKIIEVIQKPEMAKEIGKKAKEKVRDNFLITRLLSDYLSLLHEVFG